MDVEICRFHFGFSWNLGPMGFHTHRLLNVRTIGLQAIVHYLHCNCECQCLVILQKFESALFTAPLKIKIILLSDNLKHEHCFQELNFPVWANWIRLFCTSLNVKQNTHNVHKSTWKSLNCKSHDINAFPLRRNTKTYNNTEHTK